jgi:hypothetical protein
MAMARIETPFHQVFLNEGNSGIKEVIYAQQKENIEEMKKLLRRNFTMMKIKWLCCKEDICWRCLWNIYEGPIMLQDGTYGHRDSRHKYDCKTINMSLEKEPEVLEACVNHFQNENPQRYPHLQNAVDLPDLIFPKIVGKNLGYLEGTCYDCLLVDERDKCPWLGSINDLRFTKDIIITPKRFMMIGIVFKYIFTRKYDLNYYSSIELDKESLKVEGPTVMWDCSCHI